MESELDREMFEAHKDLAIQVMAHSFLLYALLSVTERQSLQKVRAILGSHAETGGYQGVGAAALRDAQRIFSELCDSGDPIDPRKLLRLIPGGKKEG